MIAEPLERIRGMALDILNFEGLELAHLELKRAPGGLVLRLFIDRQEGGVTVDDCARVSRQLSALLDVEDPIEGHYTLEVSSPGLDRPLSGEKDFQRFAGEQVRVTTFAPVEGRRHFVGRLVGLMGDSIRLILPEGHEVAIPRSAVAKARLEPRFETQHKSAGAKGQRA